MKQPKNWSDITIRKYIERVKLSRRSGSELETIEQMIKLAAVTFECSEDEAANIPLDKLNQVNQLFKSEKPTKIVKEIRLNGQHFEFELNPNKLTASQYAGVMEATKDIDLNLHLFLFHLARPYNYSWFRKKYIKLEDHQTIQLIDQFKDIPMSVANPIAVFFFNLSVEFTKILNDYSDQKMKEMKKILDQTKTDLLKNTDGLKQSKTLVNN
jgi:hypothetical protein